MVIARAYAKVNLALQVTGKRADGYHLLDMLNTSVSLHDTLYLREAEDFLLDIVTEEAYATPGGGVGDLADSGRFAAASGILIQPAVLEKATAISPPNESLQPSSQFAAVFQTALEQNTVLRAARALGAALGQSGAHIRLVKRIPVGAGLGGGSADAAAALLGLQALWKKTLPPAQLDALALSLGADVPYCLRGGAARVGGVGERITPLAMPCSGAPLLMLLAKPEQGLSTATVFGQHTLGPPTFDMQRAIAAVQCEKADALAACGNDLTLTAGRLCPDIAACMQQLVLYADAVCLSGTGSAIWAAFSSEAMRQRAMNHCTFWHTAVQPVAYGVAVETT